MGDEADRIIEDGIAQMAEEEAGEEEGMSLRASGSIDGRTHYHGCWRDHHDCAVRLLEEAAGALPDPDKLELLAAWFDLQVANTRRDDAIQNDLREWARRAREVLWRIRGTG